VHRRLNRLCILSDEEGGDDARVSLQGAVWRVPAKTSQAGPSRQDEAGGSSFFKLRQTLAATQSPLDTALAELESIQGRLKHSEAVLESEKSNAFRLGMENMENDVEKFLLVEVSLSLSRLHACVCVCLDL
jgi:hypothetical protein